MGQLEIIQRKYRALASSLGERARRLWAGAEAEAIGRGGIRLVARATGMAISTVGKGRDEVRAGAPRDGIVNERRSGGGRHRLEKKQPLLLEALEKLICPTARGDPESPLRWTTKSTRVLARELTRNGYPISAQKVCRLLHDLGFSLQGTSRVKEGERHPDRDAQFGRIKERTDAHLRSGHPVISVDTKKKELVGEYANAGREWQRKGNPLEVLTYDFPDEKSPRAIPYGVFDVGANSGFVNVGVDHDTPRFAVHSIRKWWDQKGKPKYPAATKLYVTADSGGSNSAVSRVWKAQLQEFADAAGLTIEVSHFPPGTSKWNAIEHRLFSFVTLNWRGRPLISYETIVALIGATTTTKGLRVHAQLDEGRYPLGDRVPNHQLAHLALERADFHGDWNYVLKPRSTQQIEAAAKSMPHHEARVDRWNTLVAEQIASGLNSKDFCSTRGLSYFSFIRARRKLKGKIPRIRKPEPIGQREAQKLRWANLVEDQIASGLKSAEFCRTHGLSYEGFIRARRKLKGRMNKRERRDPRRRRTS